MLARMTAIAVNIFVILVVLALPGLAQGAIAPPERVPPETSPKYALPIIIESENIDIRIDDRLAEIEGRYVLRNNSGSILEANFIFPIPLDADIADFILYIDGKPVSAEVLEAVKAQAIYEDIVRQMRDPGLLQFIGQGMVQAQDYPIPANGTRELKIQYTQLLPEDGDFQKMAFPLALQGFSSSPIGSLTINVDIKVPDKLGLIYSPSHTVDINRHGKREAVVGYEGNDIRPQGDFILYIGRPEGRVGINIVTHSSGGDEGYFLAMIAPEYKEPEEDNVAKDFILLLDRSGSMAGEKVEQAKQALEFIFGNLNDADRYSLITFATEVTPYRSGWKDYNPGREVDVIDLIRSISGNGLTFIEGAFDEAFELETRDGVPCYIIFLTDGLPTVGETDTVRLIEEANRANSDGRRIFGFGVGWDVDYQFLDLLARENGGYTTSVEPGENLEAPLSEFYAKIKSPVMSDIEITFEGIGAEEIYPRKLPDLFLGGQIVITGRYSRAGVGRVLLSGVIDGKRREYDFKFAIEEARNDYLPRLWANRKVGYLLNEIRLHGENDEMVDEIISLSKKFGIITPYTSLLVVEDDKFANRGQREAFDSMDYHLLPSGGFGGGGFQSGAAGQSASKAMQSQEAAKNLGEVMPEETIESVKYAADKTFYLDEEGFWVDSDYDEERMEPVEIEYLSDEYFDLADSDRALAEYLSVGDKVVVVFKGKAYRVVEED